MASTSTKVGHTLAKVLGIKLDQHNPPEDHLTRGESAYSVSTAETYVEDEPRTADWIHDVMPSGRDVIQYFHNLFPFTKWILSYNLQWLIGDLIAGITIGAVVVPQGMAYAKLANLDVQYGLYTSFMGVILYWFFATSKDITIGPVAVMSTIVGNVITKVHKTHPHVPGIDIAGALAIICGAIIVAIGLARCGWIVEFIPLTAICAFMTGSAINICAGQVPNMMGIKVTGFNTRASTYLVIINTLKYLGHTTIDAAAGLTALFLLYFIRFSCTRLAKKFPNRSKTFFFVSTLRTVFVLLLYTLVSWLVNRHHKKKPILSLLGPVPRGFKHAQVPVINTEIIDYFASEIPASVIVLLIEHIAIAKSFGRVNNYIIDPSQEMVAIGVTNLLGPFLGAYPATGSFSRTAIKSKAGVRTPLAGVITGIVVLLAIYALPAVFYYIPNAPLAAVIIHAVGDLITPPNTVYQFWRVSPLEVIVFFAGVIVTIFTTIEIGIYVTICLSVAILLFRVVKAKGNLVGKVKIHSVIGDHLVEDKFHDRANDNKKMYDEDVAYRNIFLPIDHEDGSNPSIHVDAPYPGVFIYRFSEGFNYPNANHYLDHLVHHIFAHTRRTNPTSYPRLGDRPWNDPGPRRGQVEDDRSHLPTLKAVILDFSSVNNVDATGVQNMIDVRNQLERYAAPDSVQWHMSGIKNKWTKRALASAGFGFPSKSSHEIRRWKPIFSVTEIGGSSSAAAQAERETNRALQARQSNDIESGPVKHGVAELKSTNSGNSSSDEIDLHKQISNSKAYSRNATKTVAIVHGLNRPFFHLDLTSALQTAIANIEEEQHKRGVGTEDIKLA